jgi:hypothetical protein
MRVIFARKMRDNGKYVLNPHYLPYEADLETYEVLMEHVAENFMLYTEHDRRIGTAPTNLFSAQMSVTVIAWNAYTASPCIRYTLNSSKVHLLTSATKRPAGTWRF